MVYITCVLSNPNCCYSDVMLYSFLVYKSNVRYVSVSCMRICIFVCIDWIFIVLEFKIKYVSLFILTSISFPCGNFSDTPQTTPRQQRGWAAEG